MDDHHRLLLRRHTLSLRRDLEPRKLLPYLVSVLDTYDEQEIKNQFTREDQVDKILEILPRKGPQAFHCFLEALEDVQPFLAVPLREEEEMEKKLLEMKTELGRARTHSARLRDELRMASVSLESQKNKQENIRKELEELKSLHKQILYQTKNEREKLIFNLNELNNTREMQSRELEAEKELRSDLESKCCQLGKELNEKSQEITDLKFEFQRLLHGVNHGIVDGKNTTQLNSRKQFPPDSRKLSFDETKVRSKHEIPRKRTYSEKISSMNGEEEIVQENDDTQSCADDNLDVIMYSQCEEILECMQHNAELVELERNLDLVKVQREHAVALCKNLEDKLKVYEETKSQVDRSTSPMEDADSFSCKKCALLESLLESQCKKIKQEKETEISRLEEESKKLVECKLKEVTDKFEREKKTLDTNLCKLEELYNTSKVHHANEIKNMRDEITEQHFNDMKELKTTKEEFASQIDRDRFTISRLRSEMDKERDTHKSIQKDFEKFKKKTTSEKKQTRQKHEQELKSKNSSLKDAENELKGSKECQQRNLDEISKLKTVTREQKDIQEHLMEELERWKTLPGRIFNYKKDFDRNGIIYNLGTKHIQVMRSSSYEGKPEDILDTRKGTLSCTCDVENSWWRVDFGEDHALFATLYTLRHGRDNGMSVIRNWNLEGSRDGRIWKVLKKHENERGLKGTFPFYTGTWAIEGSIEAMRYFRIHQTGKNSSGRHALCLSGFEIYGVLLDMR